MTIAMIGQKGLPARSGGVERHVALLATGLASRGHRVIVYGRSWYAQPSALPEGIEQRLTQGIRTKYLDAITHGWTALMDVRSQHPDIIHLHGTGVALLTPVARLVCPRAKLVVTFHCQDWKLSKWRGFGWAFRLGEWFACHFSDRAITVSQALVEYCVEQYGCQPTYIPHPFSIPQETPSSERLARHDLKSGQYLLFVGRLIADKQAHLLIDAYAMAKQAYPDLFADIQLVLVGGASWTDSYAKWLSRYAAQTPGVKMLGECLGEELATLQAHARGHVFPTSSEGMSVAILEAAGYRQPMVVSAIPQNHEATGGHAIYVTSMSVRELCQGIVELVSMPEAQRQAMGERLRQHVAKTFGYRDRIDDMCRMYAELLGGDARLVTPIQKIA